MELYSTKIYDKWFERLKDKIGKSIIDAKLFKIKHSGNFGDHEIVAKNITELKIHHGPGYRIYLTTKEDQVIILLIGGDKSTQARDIKKAERMAASISMKEVRKWD